MNTAFSDHPIRAKGARSGAAGRMRTAGLIIRRRPLPVLRRVNLNVQPEPAHVLRAA